MAENKGTSWATTETQLNTDFFSSSLYPSSELMDANSTNSTPTLTTSLSQEEELARSYQANSHSQAIIYVVVVLGFYALALTFLLIKYLKRERRDNRMLSFYDGYSRGKEQRTNQDKCMIEYQSGGMSSALLACGQTKKSDESGIVCTPV